MVTQIRGCVAFGLFLLLYASAGHTQPPATAATVNGEVITVDEWITRMKNLRAQDFVQSTNPLRFKGIGGGQVALEALITQKLVMQYATKTSLVASDAEVEADLQTAKAQPAVKQSLDKKIFTEAQLRDDIKFQRTLFNVVTINQQVTAQEVRAFYDRRTDLYQPERWELAVIRVSTKAIADTVTAEIKKGTPFAEVAAKYSEDKATKDKGGVLGTVGANDPTLPAFIKEAVKTLKVGDVTPPIQAAGAGGTPFFIVRLLGRQVNEAQAFDKIKNQVERAALLEKAGGSEALDRKLADFKKTSTVVISLPGYEDLYKKQP
jgi:parvulin-like peptidyl-prolyl isomerase